MTDTPFCAHAAEPLPPEEQIKRLQRAYDEQVRCNDELADRLSAREAELAEARKVISFYADVASWAHPPAEPDKTIAVRWGAIQFESPPGHILAPALVDHGKVARAFVAKHQPKENSDDRH